LPKKNNKMSSIEDRHTAYSKLDLSPAEPKWFAAFEAFLDTGNPRPLATLLRSEPAPSSAQEFLAELLDPRENVFQTLKLTKPGRAAGKVETWTKMAKIGREIALAVSKISRDPLTHEDIVDAVVIDLERKKKKNLSRSYLHKCYRAYMDIEHQTRSLASGSVDEVEEKTVALLRHLYS
jgi:hypothetical protein